LNSLRTYSAVQQPNASERMHTSNVNGTDTVLRGQDIRLNSMDRQGTNQNGPVMTQSLKNGKQKKSKGSGNRNQGSRERQPKQNIVSPMVNPRSQNLIPSNNSSNRNSPCVSVSRENPGGKYTSYCNLALQRGLLPTPQFTLLQIAASANVHAPSANFHAPSVPVLNIDDNPFLELYELIANPPLQKHDNVHEVISIREMAK